jgi:hypothetical protein
MLSIWEVTGTDKGSRTAPISTQNHDYRMGCILWAMLFNSLCLELYPRIAPKRLQYFIDGPWHMQATKAVLNECYSEVKEVATMFQVNPDDELGVL